ncbi:hypothetical protein SAXI111661_10965 [Saccharomonospora xinjiangensis]|uniref:PE domain-containing protein n=1 Tax=Saccharomonospora xinjiangensis XJ-54 TaxID=882086 RepID=I0V6W9_9PSEU|nr:hypothetical protein [Saccharomonospora xinjiangensis]EID55872.1 hypothetical protein SacxiDRAFT_3679 [Saccharomonospora xinjiangensis XJ-54]QBQ61140.1 hypothetical protein EYD13_13940 [Saccharomonospora xinjiangensis]
MTEADVRIPSDGFAVDPELAADTFARLSEVQDTVGQLARRAAVLGRTVPLGDGYAREIGEFMATYGIADTGSAVESLTRFGQEIENLKQRIDTALRRYDDQDRTASRGVDCVGGG